MSKFNVFFLVCFFLLFPCLSQAQATFDLRWTSTTGSGAVGSNVIVAEPGDQLVADLELSEGGLEVLSYLVSTEFDVDFGDELDLISVVQFKPTLDILLWNFFPGPDLLESTPLQGGEIFNTGAFTVFPVNCFAGGPVTIAQFTFEVTENVADDGPDVAVGFFSGPTNSVIACDSTDISNLTTFGELTVLPEPNANLGLIPGLALLGMLYRRRINNA